LERRERDFGAGMLLAAAPLFIVSAFYAFDLALLTLLVPGIGWLAVLGMGPAVLAWRRGHAPRIDAVAWSVALLLIGLFVFQLRGSYVVPAHDHLTPLAVAKAIARTGTALHQPYAEGASLPAYPPGLGILLAPLYRLLGDVAPLGVFTWIAGAVIGLMPLSWAYMLRRLYLPAAPLWPLVIAMAIGFFLLDRSLMSASIYAGKNSFVVAMLFLPIALVFLIEAIGDWRKEALAAAACLGVVLMHYSATYMLACFLAAWLLVERPRAGVWIRLGAIGALVLIAFLPLALHAQRSSMMLTVTSVYETGFRFLAGLLSEKLNTVLFIYNDSGKLRIASWPWKGWALIGSVSFLMIIAAVAARRRDPLAGYVEPLARAGVTLLLAGLFVAGLGSGLLPNSGIEKIYASWCLIFFMAPIFAAVLLGLWSTTKLATRRPAVLLIGALTLLAGLGAGGFAFRDDYLKARRYVLKQASSRDEIAALAEILARIEAKGRCALIMQGGVVDLPVAMGDIRQITHGYRPLDYASLISRCVVLTGSFTTLAAEGGRALGGYPAVKVIAGLPADSKLLFIGPEGDLARYLRSMPTLRAEPGFERLGPHVAVELTRI